MNTRNYYIGVIKDGTAYVTRIPLKLEPAFFIADQIGAAHFPLRKLDVSSYEGKAVIISDNNGYQARVIETLEDEVTQALKEMLSGNQD